MLTVKMYGYCIIPFWEGGGGLWIRRDRWCRSKVNRLCAYRLLSGWRWFILQWNLRLFYFLLHCVRRWGTISFLPSGYRRLLSGEKSQKTLETDLSFLCGTEFKKCRTSGARCVMYGVNIIKMYQSYDKWLISMTVRDCMTVRTLGIRVSPRNLEKNVPFKCLSWLLIIWLVRPMEFTKFSATCRTTKDKILQT